MLKQGCIEGGGGGQGALGADRVPPLGSCGGGAQLPQSDWRPMRAWTGTRRPQATGKWGKSKTFFCKMGPLIKNNGPNLKFFFVLELVYLGAPTDLCLSLGQILGTRLCLSTSMENFHPLRQTPSHAYAPNSAHRCAEYAHPKALSLWCHSYSNNAPYLCTIILGTYTKIVVNIISILSLMNV